MNDTSSREVFSPHNRFERIELPLGQLSLVAAIKRELPPTFTADLIKAEPWNNPTQGMWLKEEKGRRVQLYDINGHPLVLKEMQMSGVEVSNEVVSRKKGAIQSFVPSAQVALIEEAKLRFRESYSQDLPVEELIGFYIDRPSTKKYMFYQHYPLFDINTPGVDAWSVINESHQEVEELNRKLRWVMFHRGETGTNYLVTPDQRREQGWRVVLVDTEYWREIPERRKR